MNRPFNYTISDNFVLTISQISRDLEKISQYTRVMPISSGIKKSCDIRNVQAVLRLSGYTADRLTEKEYAIRTGNISRAMEFAGTADLSDISACCQLHALLMDGLSSDAGSFRTGRHVRESTPASRVLPSASTIPQLMRDLFEWTQKAKVHPVIRAAVFFVRCCIIMPFPDGNMLFARIWARALLSSGYDPIFQYLPFEEKWTGHESEYDIKIRGSVHYQDYGDILDFWADRISESVQDFLRSLDTAPRHPAMSSSVQKLLEVMDEKAYSTKELMAMTGLKHRQTFRDNYLLPAIRDGYIRMTVPDKPNSRNQKYVRTMDEVRQ